MSTNSIYKLKSFKDFVTEEVGMMSLNPGMNVIGMGPVQFPGNNQGSQSTMGGNYVGSGDVPMFVASTGSKDDEEEEEEKKKRIQKMLGKKETDQTDEN